MAPTEVETSDSWQLPFSPSWVFRLPSGKRKLSNWEKTDN